FPFLYISVVRPREGQADRAMPDGFDRSGIRPGPCDARWPPQDRATSRATLGRTEPVTGGSYSGSPLLRLQPFRLPAPAQAGWPSAGSWPAAAVSIPVS